MPANAGARADRSTAVGRRDRPAPTPALRTPGAGRDGDALVEAGEVGRAIGWGGVAEDDVDPPALLRQVADIERALQLLQQDPRIERVDARLSPGERAGEAVLSLRVEEASPYRVSLEASNYAPVAFGSYRGQALLAHRNLLGFGDTLEARLRVSGGLFGLRGDYRLPVGPRGPELSLLPREWLALLVPLSFVIALGLHPSPLVHLGADAAQTLLARAAKR